MSSRACGFPCPACGHCCSDVEGDDLAHILELRCSACGWAFAVEV